ncbi:MAG: flagellar assembly protein FliW [Phycisphaeraceae bacterium]
MRIETSRFGTLDIDGERTLEFPRGLLGFERYTRYALLEAGDESYFWWLQSTESPELAFVVTDPAMFVPTYRVPIHSDQCHELAIDSPEQAQVFVIVNKRGAMLTGNLQGPLVVHVQTRIGQQLVLSDRRFTTRVPLVEVGTPQLQAASA